MFERFLKADHEELELRQELNALKIELSNAERWIERSKDTIEKIQNQLMDMEDRNGKF